MGRPLNKRLFGSADTGATASGNEIKVDFYNGTAVVQGFIVRQKGSKTFLCSEAGAADTTHLCTLTTGKLSSALSTGEMMITFMMDDDETYQASKITGRKATLVKESGNIGNNIYDGKSVPWNFTVSTSDGAAQVEEAGDDDAGTNADDFTAA